MRRLKPVVFSEETMKSVNQQLGKQEISTKAPKSADPKNYPVFEIPLMGRVFVYVPNHTVMVDGVSQLRMDTPLIHVTSKGNQFQSFRCIKELVAEEAGYDGTCPMCDAVSIGWDLANEIIESKCEAAHLDPEDKENSSVKAIRSAAFNDRALKDAGREYTYPLIVFETTNNGKTLVQDPDTKEVKYTIMWYSITEAQYNKTWKKTLDTMEDEPVHPGGRFFLLNYEYDTKGKEPNIRDSARNLTVTPRNRPELNKLREVLDKATESWTPALARQMVIKNQLYSYDDLAEVAEDVSAPSRNLLELYKARKAGGAEAGIADNGGFTLTEQDSSEPPAVSMDNETDLD